MRKLLLIFLLALSSCSIEVRPSPTVDYYRTNVYYRRYYYIPPPRYYYAQPIYIKPTTPRPPRRGYYGPRK